MASARTRYPPLITLVLPRGPPLSHPLSAHAASIPAFPAGKDVVIVGVRRILPPAKHSRKAERPRTRTLTSVGAKTKLNTVWHCS